MDKFIAEIRPDPPFSYKSTLFAHGWADLEPFRIGQDLRTLNYSLLIAPQKIVQVKIIDESDTTIRIFSDEDLGQTDIERVVDLIRHIFRLDENFAEFYHIAETEPAFKWIVEKKAGRLLRAGSLWEDMVKILCTTNCSWHLTKLMVSNMVQKIAQGTHFPEPAEIAVLDENFLRKEVKMGYRAPFLLEMAQNVKNNLIDLKQWAHWVGNSEELFKEMRKIKGLGEYAVSSILKLLGHYDYLGIDSWGRRTFAERYNQGKRTDDRSIRSKYKKYGKWSGLFFWMDLTQDLYINKK